MTFFRTSFRRALLSLFSSMRFAVSLLAVLAIAAVIGTVLKQNTPSADYIVEFGEFWAKLFDALGLNDVFHATGFLLILLLLIVSVSLCLWRHTPKLLRDLKCWRENATLDSLRALPLHAESPRQCERELAVTLLTASGFRIREIESGQIWLIVGKKGNLHKVGYLFAHAAIVVICLGGLLDSNLPLKFMELSGFHAPETRDLPPSQVPAQSRLAANNHAFCGNVTIPENGIADAIILNTGKGYYVQELPFAIKLNRFTVEYYATGQPKRFMSEIELLDRVTDKVLQQADIEVNKPLTYAGITIYQTSFGDGGSALNFVRHNLADNIASTTLTTRSQSAEPISLHNRPYLLELGDFRVFNVENLSIENPSALNSKMASAFKLARSVRGEKRTQNLGPSIEFKLRDNAGQTVEFRNYLAPYSEDNHLYQLTGSRKNSGAPFRFIRVPLDKLNSPATFLRLRAALLDSTLYPEIARRTAGKAEPSSEVSAQAQEKFRTTVTGVLDRFAQGGFPAIDRFLDEKIPPAQRQAVAQTYLKVLQDAVIDAMNVAQAKAGLPALPVDDSQYRFLQDSLVATSGFFEYGAPAWLQLTGFEEIESSGFQLTRAPGQPIVYLGALLLIIGVFFMFYIREVRCWLRITPQGTLLAMTANHQNDELAREFAALSQALIGDSEP